MRRYARAGRLVARTAFGLGRLGRLAVVPSCLAFVACAPATRYSAPSNLRAYQILITRQDSLSREIARRLKRRGFDVRDAVEGGSPPTAYLILFTQREPEPGSLTWLCIRLADTRTGAIVAAVTAPRSALGATPAAQARAIVDSLASQPSLRRLQPPS